jgi:hypothetical protein
MSMNPFNFTEYYLPSPTIKNIRAALVWSDTKTYSTDAALRGTCRHSGRNIEDSNTLPGCAILRYVFR